MPVYIWKGKTASGQIQSGEITANSPQEVYSILRERKIVPTSVRPKPKELSLPFGKGVGLRDLSIFTRQFATMINAGLPLIKCLEIQEEQVQKQSFKKILRNIINDVEGGSTLADALKKHKDVFSELYVNMVAAGESGGALDVILERLATYLEKNAEIIRKIKGAMIYPAMIAIVMVLAVTVMLLFVIPVFAGMFSGIGAELPGPTRFVMWMSDFLRKNFFYIVGVIAAVAIVIRFYYKTEDGHFRIDAFLLKVPIFGDLIKKQALTRFSRTLATLLSSGVNILDALEITAKTSGNRVIEKAILRARASIAQGESIATPLAKEKGLFPPMVVQMITIGEQTGGLDEMLNKVADFYDSEVDQAVENLMAAIEPIVIVVLGVVVGGMLMAMYLPIFKLATEFMGG
ncbi:MAG TPA: type II secretion system F family protein [candidate division WOR-3 bacterium]|uniref:Type II secretion system F family protein n=1 Tax=candidate division WOR-3 bacterium TaxID=2052148 RepID=A0A7C0VAT4_UNCW3|nr:type II secretion system F family protein [candidate division WOR-3 bacterium]